jgi:prephenate dehydratase
MFFADLSGRPSEEPVAAAIAGVRGRCEQVRVLGAYRAGQDPHVRAG